MKRCPTCNRTFQEDWLAFCTQDGATLIEESATKADEPPPTILAPPPPPLPGSWKSPSADLGSAGGAQFPSQPISPPPPPPANLGVPSGGFGPSQYQPPAMQTGWQPPPPPPYALGPKQGLAVASMICGIFTMTFGWCCSIGVISGIVAIALGAYQLVQIKNNPDQNTGKPFAITGIVTSAVYFLIWIVLMLIYGFAIFMGSLANH